MSKPKIELILPAELSHRVEDFRLAIEEEMMLSDNGGVTTKLFDKFDVTVTVRDQGATT